MTQPLSAGSTVAETVDERTRTLGWRQLLIAATVAELVLLAASAAILGDIEAAGIAAACAVGLALLGLGAGRLGAAAMGLMFANVLAWMLPGAVDNMLHGAAALSLGLLLPSALTAVSVAGLAAAVPVALGRAGDGARAPGWVAAGAAALLAVFLAGGMLTSQGAAAGGTAQLTSANMAYDTTALTVPADEAAVAMTNSDLFWHTFTVDELGIDLWVPVRGERTIAIDAPPGTYEFYCRIPGHETIGMRGTLTVEG